MNSKLLHFVKYYDSICLMINLGGFIMNNNQDFNNNQYNQYNYDNNQYTPENEVAPAKKTMAIWSLIMGIASLVCSCCGGGLLWGILGVVFASSSKKNNEDGDGMAKAGKIMGIIGIVATVVIAIVYIVMIAMGVASFDSYLYY